MAITLSPEITKQLHATIKRYAVRILIGPVTYWAPAGRKTVT